MTGCREGSLFGQQIVPHKASDLLPQQALGALSFCCEVHIEQFDCYCVCSSYLRILLKWNRNMFRILNPTACASHRS